MAVKKHVTPGGSRKAKPKTRRRTTDADIPELGADWFEQADEYLGTKLVRRGRPPGSARKTQTTLRVSNEVLAYFRAAGPGWQTRMDDVLREYVAARLK
jgi:uncharacterized protein (DUF4415 family)